MKRCLCGLFLLGLFLVFSNLTHRKPQNGMAFRVPKKKLQSSKDQTWAFGFFEPGPVIFVEKTYGFFLNIFTYLCFK